jgi:5-methylcytosine-specific restriction endonuclease McrA
MELTGQSSDYWLPRDCLREPIPELLHSAWLLDRAVSAHLSGDRSKASKYFLSADTNTVRDWIESLWGSKKNWPEQESYLRYREINTPLSAKSMNSDRMPTVNTKRELIKRDGYNCRFCGLPVVPTAIRKAIHKDYPIEVKWGKRNIDQHAGFQALWLQFDHVIPYAYGGESSLENMVISCAGCNYGRGDFTLEQLGLNNPLDRSPHSTNWDGLMRYLSGVDGGFL